MERITWPGDQITFTLCLETHLLFRPIISTAPLLPLQGWCLPVSLVATVQCSAWIVLSPRAMTNEPTNEIPERLTRIWRDSSCDVSECQSASPSNGATPRSITTCKKWRKKLSVGWQINLLVKYFSDKASGVESIAVPHGDLEETWTKLGTAQVRVDECLIPSRL